MSRCYDGVVMFGIDWFHAAPAEWPAGMLIVPRADLDLDTLIAHNKHHCDPLDEYGQQWRRTRVWVCQNVHEAAYWGRPGDSVYRVVARDPQPLARPIPGWDRPGQYHSDHATIIEAVATVCQEEPPEITPPSRWWRLGRCPK